MPCSEDFCFRDLVAAVTLPLRCLELIKRVFEIDSQLSDDEHVAVVQALYGDCRCPTSRLEVQSSTKPRDYMPVVIEIVSDGEDDRT